MAARNRVTYAPLDLESARAALAADKLVRVGIVPTGYFPDGGSGRLRAVGDPAVDGEEFIKVEVNIGGAKDVIPFAPSDLTPIKRGQASPEPLSVPKPPTRTRTRAVVTADSVRSTDLADSPSRPSGTPASTRSNVESLDARRAETRSTAAATAATLASAASAAGLELPPTLSPIEQPVKGAAGTPRTAGSGKAIGSDVTKADPGASETAGRPATKKPTQRGKRAPVSITISTTGVENTGWQVEARLGAKVVVKACPLSPARAAQLVAALDNASLTGFVADVLAEHRAQAQAKADRLAGELAAVQAELAEYAGR